MITLSGSRVLFFYFLLFFSLYIFPTLAAPNPLRGQLTAIIAGYLSGFASLFGILFGSNRERARSPPPARTKDEGRRKSLACLLSEFFFYPAVVWLVATSAFTFGDVFIKIDNVAAQAPGSASFGLFGSVIFMRVLQNFTPKWRLLNVLHSPWLCPAAAKYDLLLG